MNKQLRSAVSRLRRTAPPLLPVRVYIRHLVNEYGTCQLKVDSSGRPLRFVICLAHGMTPYLEQLTLLHEWAHALTWQEGDGQPEDHGAGWALAYGRLYQMTFQS